MGDRKIETLYPGPGHALPVGKDPSELAIENQIDLPMDQLVAGTRAHVGKVMVQVQDRLETPEWDLLDDTASPLGVFDYQGLEKRTKDKEAIDAANRTASFLKGVLKGALDLEAVLGEAGQENAKDFIKFAELVSFLANISYIPKDNPGLKDEKKQEFSIRSYGIAYNPGQFNHGDRHSDIGKIPPEDTTEYVFEVRDRITGKILEISLFPNRYSNYGIEQLEGVSLQEAAEILSERTRGRRSLDDHPDVLNYAKATLREPSLRVSLRGPDRQLISSMRGNLVASPVMVAGREGKHKDYLMGFDLRPDSGRDSHRFSGTRVFMPIGVRREGLLRGVVRDLSGLDIRRPSPVRRSKPA